MTNVTTTSTRFTLNVSDFVKGGMMAVLVPVIAIIMNSLNEGSLTFNWNQIAVAALGGFFGYLTKNFFSPSQIVIKDAETVKAVKEGDSEVKVINK